jgi:hypothetical protein
MAAFIMAVKLADWFHRGRFLNNFPIGSYVKTMSADGGHFEPRSGSLNFKANTAWMVLNCSIFKMVSGDPDLHPRWPPSADNVCFKLVYWFQRNFFLNMFSIGSYVKAMSADTAILDGGRGHRT